MPLTFDALIHARWFYCLFQRDVLFARSQATKIEEQVVELGSKDEFIDFSCKNVNITGVYFLFYYSKTPLIRLHGTGENVGINRGSDYREYDQNT